MSTAKWVKNIDVFDELGSFTPLIKTVYGIQASSFIEFVVQKKPNYKLGGLISGIVCELS